MSVVEEPNGKPQIFSKWGHKEFLVIRGICFFVFIVFLELLRLFVFLIGLLRLMDSDGDSSKSNHHGSRGRAFLPCLPFSLSSSPTTNHRTRSFTNLVAVGFPAVLEGLDQLLHIA